MNKLRLAFLELLLEQNYDLVGIWSCSLWEQTAFVFYYKKYVYAWYYLHLVSIFKGVVVEWQLSCPEMYFLSNINFYIAKTPS